MTFYSLGAEHDAKRKMHVFENGPLLDMQLQIGPCVAAFNASVTDSVDINITVLESVLKTNSITVCADAVDGDGMSADKCRRTEEASAESSALLIGPIDQSNRDRRPAVKVLREAAQHAKASENAQASIQPTAIRNRVKMTAKDKSVIGIALKGCPGVPSGIKVMLYRKAFQLALKPCARLEPGRTPRNALSTIRIGRKGAKLLEI
jgi:hypothetical protein